MVIDTHTHTLCVAAVAELRKEYSGHQFDVALVRAAGERNSQRWRARMLQLVNIHNNKSNLNKSGAAIRTSSSKALRSTSTLPSTPPKKRQLIRRSRCCC